MPKAANSVIRETFPLAVSVEVQGEIHSSNTLRDQTDVDTLRAEAEATQRSANILRALIDAVDAKVPSDNIST